MQETFPNYYTEEQNAKGFASMGYANFGRTNNERGRIFGWYDCKYCSRYRIDWVGWKALMGTSKLAPQTQNH